MTATPTPPPGFVRGNDRLAKALANPDVAERVEAERARMCRSDAALAMIRSAAGLTQAQLAEALGTQQSAVSRLERGGDLLLSSLSNYLRAAGGDAAQLVVTINNERIAVDLDDLLTAKHTT